MGAVSGRAAFLIDPEGHRFPVAARLVVGRSRDVDVVVQSGGVARQHFALLRLPSGHFEAEDLGSTHGTRLNGVALDSRVLVSGDVLELDERRYVFELGPEEIAPVDPAVVLLARAADDEGSLRVAIDLLLEQGNALVAPLASGQRLPLSPQLDEAIALGSLELEWRCGFVHAARLRAQGGPFAVRRLFFALMAAEAGRFLHTLTVPEFHPRFDLEGSPLPALRVLRFGPFFTAEASGRCREALARARFTGAPWLGTPEVQQYTRAWLEFGGGQRRDLEQGRQETFPTCTVRWEPDGWLVCPVRPARAVRWNARQRFSALLAPGDVVSSDSTHFTFCAS